MRAAHTCWAVRRLVTPPQGGFLYSPHSFAPSGRGQREQDRGRGRCQLLWGYSCHTLAQRCGRSLPPLFLWWGRAPYSLTLPHGRELRPAVPHSLVPPSGEGKAPALCSLGLQGGQGGELALRACLARIVRCLQGTCSTSVPGGPRGGGRVRCGLAHPYNVSPLPVTVFTKPLVPRTGSVAEGCGVLSESPTDTILSRGSGQNTNAELPGSHGQPPDVEGRRAKGPLPRDTIAGQ